MRTLILVLFIGCSSFLYPQFEGAFITEPEINYDLYYKTCNVLRDSINVFFAKQITHIPIDYEKGVSIFFTAEKDGTITDIEFENDLVSDFDDELTSFLKKNKFDNPFISNFIGDSFNVRMSVKLKYTLVNKHLDIRINHYTYWKENLSEKNILIRKLKPEYNKSDTISFEIINNHEIPLFLYFSIEGKLRGQFDWIDSNVWNSHFSLNTKQLDTIDSKDTLSFQLLATDFYDVPDFYRIVLNYGFNPSDTNEKAYSYSFTIKKDEVKLVM